MINFNSFKNIEITKAYQEGVYSDTLSNRKLGRVGVLYKQPLKKENNALLLNKITPKELNELFKEKQAKEWGYENSEEAK